MAPAFGLLQDQVPIAVLKQLVSIAPLPPPLLRDALAPVRLLPSGLGHKAQFCSWLHHFGQDMSSLRGHFPTPMGDAAEGDPD